MHFMVSTYNSNVSHICLAYSCHHDIRTLCTCLCVQHPCADLQEDIEDALRTSRQGNLLRQGLQVSALTTPAGPWYGEALPFTPGHMGVKGGMKGGSKPFTPLPFTVHQQALTQLQPQPQPAQSQQPAGTQWSSQNAYSQNKQQNGVGCTAAIASWGTAVISLGGECHRHVSRQLVNWHALPYLSQQFKLAVDLLHVVCLSVIEVCATSTPLLDC